MWYIATFRPVTLFSLRPANATVSGGKTLVTPTPFAIKMALLDAAIRTEGQAQGEAWWPAIRDLIVAVALPENFLVVKTFQRILRPKAPEDRDGTGLVGPWSGNIVYREYIHYETSDEIDIAVQPSGDEDVPWGSLFSRINYFGKRGSFFQFMAYDMADKLDESHFTNLTAASPAFAVEGMMQLLDDCGAGMTFAHANVYDEKERSLKINDPRGRLLNLIVLPYRQINAGRNFTAYQRLEV